MHLRRTATVAILCAGLALTASCQDTDAEPKPLPPLDNSSTPSDVASTPTPTPSPTETTAPAWQDKYSETEIEAYEAALERFTTYEQRSEPIWRKGKATPAAKSLFKQYFLDGEWQRQFRRLSTYEEVNVEVHGNPTVLSSRGVRIVLAEGGQSVSIRQCVDYSTSRLLQNGEQAPGGPDGPRVRRIEVVRFVGQNETPWQISGISTYEGKRRC